MLVKCERNHMVQNIKNLELIWQKMVNYFLESVDGILEEVSVT